MIEHGHSWTEIKSYTLSQLGIFLREAAKLDDFRRKQSIYASWVGANVTEKGIKSILKETSLPAKHVVSDTDKATEHMKNWNRLAAFMKSMR